MTIVQTVLVFVGIPAGIVALLAIATFGRSMARQPNRYRPGRPWTYQPTWFAPHPDAIVGSPVTGRAQIEGGSSTTTAVGGASGEW